MGPKNATQTRSRCAVLYVGMLLVLRRWAAPWLNHLDNSLRVTTEQIHKINLCFELEYLLGQLFILMAHGSV